MSLVVAAIAAGGAVGACVRYVLTRRLSNGLLVVNSVGSALLGVTLALDTGSLGVRFVAVGCCGAFTTFSSVMVKLDRLVADDPRAAARYAVLTAVTGVAAVVCGHVVGRWITTV